MRARASLKDREHDENPGLGFAGRLYRPVREERIPVGKA
jgi:hypothetical protein